jgi:beta-N-acetylhexosaminidase
MRMRWRGLALSLCLMLLVCAGCGGASVAGKPIPTGTPTSTSSSTRISTLDQRIDAYIARLTPAQQIGQTLMLAVYANAYNARLDQALTQWHLGSAIVFPNYNGGPLMPTTLAGMQGLVRDLQAHADTPLLLATDEEGGLVDRLSFYYGQTCSYGPTCSPRELAATGDPQQAYAQAQTDAQRMRELDRVSPQR